MRPAIMSMTAAICANATAAASQRASREEVCAAIIDALSILRKAIGEQAGYAAQRSFDDFLKNRLIARGLERIRLGDKPSAVSLPVMRPGPVPNLIMEEAVHNCLALNGTAPGNLYVESLATVLLGHLIDFLGGLPEISELLKRIGTSERHARLESARTVWMQ